MFWKYYFYKSDEQWPILDKGQQNLKQSTLETKKVTLVGQIVSKIPRISIATFQRGCLPTAFKRLELNPPHGASGGGAKKNRRVSYRFWTVLPVSSQPLHLSPQYRNYFLPYSRSFPLIYTVGIFTKRCRWHLFTKNHKPHKYNLLLFFQRQVPVLLWVTYQGPIFSAQKHLFRRVKGPVRYG